jgi:site-specific recombinase XerD
LFEEFCHSLRVEKETAPRTIEAYRWCFRDYESFVMKQLGGTVLVSHFTAETCRAYQYDLAARGLQTSSIRVRLATLGSLGKWAVRRDKIARNPVAVLTRPRRKARLPRVPRWETVESVLQQCTDVREKTLVALMCFGGLRRSEIVALDVGDVAPGLGLRRVQGKGGAETAVPLPKVAQDILADYIAMAHADATATDPLFVSRFKRKGGQVIEARMKGHRVWKISKAMGKRAASPRFGGATAIRIPPPTALKLRGENSSNFGVVAPTGFEPVFQPRPRFRHISQPLRPYHSPKHPTRLKHAVRQSDLVDDRHRAGGTDAVSPSLAIGATPGTRYLVRVFLAHLNLAPGPDIPDPAPSPTTPPPPRNPRQAAHRRCPITGSTQPPGPRSAPLPPPLTTAGFRAHHPRKESAPNGAAGAGGGRQGSRGMPWCNGRSTREGADTTGRRRPCAASASG